MYSTIFSKFSSKLDGGYANNFQKFISLHGTVKGDCSVFSRMAAPKFKTCGKKLT
jgi:hypothetical protein